MEKIRRNILASLVLLVLILAINGCKEKQINIPALTEKPTNNYIPGKFVWHDLLTDKVEVVKDFYKELFGWEYEKIGDGKLYTLIKYKGKRIGGIAFTEDLETKVDYSQWMTYLSVNNVDAATVKIINAGGRIMRGPMELPNRGRFAAVEDPQGALIALLKADGGDPENVIPVLNDWLWNELWTDSISASSDFYKKLVGYNSELLKLNGKNFYHVLKINGKSRCGVVKIMWDWVKPNWLPYIAVSDPGKIVEKAKTIGGKILLSSKNVVGGHTAIIADPSGAAFAVEKWPLLKSETN